MPVALALVDTGLLPWDVGLTNAGPLRLLAPAGVSRHFHLGASEGDAQPGDVRMNPLAVRGSPARIRCASAAPVAENPGSVESASWRSLRASATRPRAAAIAPA